MPRIGHRSVVVGPVFARSRSMSRARLNFCRTGTKPAHSELGSRRGRIAISMASFIDHDRIAEKLEIARTMGLVTNYLVSPSGPTARSDPSVKVWCNQDASEATIRDLLRRLLDGLVTDEQILIVAPFIEAAAAAPGKTDDGSAVPVAA